MEVETLGELFSEIWKLVVSFYVSFFVALLFGFIETWEVEGCVDS